MRRVTIIDGHPDPSGERLNHALSRRYAEAAAAAGNEVRRIDIARMHFPLLRESQDFYRGEPCEEIARAQSDIAWADHLVIFVPLWMNSVPALFKGFIEQTFRPKFALDEGKHGFPKGLLGGKTARIVMTMGMPTVVFRVLAGEHALKSLKQALSLCGIAPIEESLIGSVGDASEKTRRGWFDEIERNAQHDATEARHPNRAIPALVTTGVVLGGAYLGVRRAMHNRGR